MSPTQQQPLRLWPGVVAAIIQGIVWLIVPLIFKEAVIWSVIGGLVGALAILVWWLFFSRVPRLERWGALVVMLVAVGLTPLILHPSIVGGMMGMMFRISVIPGLGLALVVWAVIAGRLSVGLRRAALVAAIFVACGAWALVRTDGVKGNGRSQLAWRWAKTAEEQLLAKSVEPVAAPVVAARVTPPEERPVAPATPVPTPAPTPTPAAAPTELPPPRTKPHTTAIWPGFRGPHRDDVVTGVRIKTDWAATPPVELWRRPIGPGWSSFAVGDGLIYTQEQRGEFEVVSCYKAANGQPEWTHRDNARFYESNGGAGPRATPTLFDGRVYTFGATGILNALDAITGAVVWTRNAASDTGAKTPGWGFAGSPLVVDNRVVVAASGRLAAYDPATGSPRWKEQTGGGSYSSPQLLTIDGVPQVVMLNSAGATSVAPADGKVLWKHEWPGTTILQPVMTPDGGVLITSGDMGGGMGTRRLAVAQGTGGWTVKEVWTSTGMKPYFNDIVVHDSYAFGFDGSILSCIDLQDGKRKWKGGRYGHGQMLLLADQSLLLVLSEEGELALVEAVPDQFKEVTRFPAMDDKTWNHLVVAGSLLLVRNGKEMVAFRLPVAGS
jgi:outer membrane protein assembly factor BamB